MQDCIFCQIIAGQIPAKVIDRTDQVITILSLQNHPLIIPIKHLENIYQLDDQTGHALMSETIKIAKAVKNGLKADGINIIQNNEPAGGQEVMHLHIHIKPRFKKDGLNLKIIETETKGETIFEQISQALPDEAT